MNECVSMSIMRKKRELEILRIYFHPSYVVNTLMAGMMETHCDLLSIHGKIRRASIDACGTPLSINCNLP